MLCVHRYIHTCGDIHALLLWIATLFAQFRTAAQQESISFIEKENWEWFNQTTHRLHRCVHAMDGWKLSTAISSSWGNYGLLLQLLRARMSRTREMKVNKKKGKKERSKSDLLDQQNSFIMFGMDKRKIGKVWKISRTCVAKSRKNARILRVGVNEQHGKLYNGIFR